jgi:type IV secretory pathway VirB10-like protein
MNGEDQTERPEAETADPDSAVKLRGDPPRVMRLSRKAIGIASACGFALVGGAMIYALQPVGRKGAEELYNTDGVAVADNLSGAPKDYGQVPRLGPPLPGDLGKPILDAQRRGTWLPCRRLELGHLRLRSTLQSLPLMPPGSAPNRNEKQRAVAACSSAVGRRQAGVLALQEFHRP